jgi:ElaB/YqjD/DUF883 family membrane-anchored ribosome-binding protein
MGKTAEPTSLSEAIAKLETAGQSKAQGIKDLLEKDYLEIKKTLESLKPQLDEIKSKVEDEAKQAKNKVETQVKDHPWAALGIIGLLAFIVGWILGNSRKH